MKKLGVMLTAVLLLAVAAPAFAVDITGQLVDRSCYMMDKTNTGIDHKMPKGDVTACAIACAKKGNAVALVTSKGEVYTVAGDMTKDSNAKLVPHMSHTVILTGEVTTDKDGNKTLTVTALKMAPKM